MAAEYDPNIELNPNPIIAAVLIFVALGFGTVFTIVVTGDAKPASVDASPID